MNSAYLRTQKITKSLQLKCYRKKLKNLLLKMFKNLSFEIEYNLFCAEVLPLIQKIHVRKRDAYIKICNMKPEEINKQNIMNLFSNVLKMESISSSYEKKTIANSVAVAANSKPDTRPFHLPNLTLNQKCVCSYFKMRNHTEEKCRNKIINEMSKFSKEMQSQLMTPQSAHKYTITGKKNTCLVLLLLY